jgi:hypothetical protein
LNTLNHRNFGKWSAICAALAVFAASGQACPPGSPGPASPLAGLWTGSISGDVTLSNNFGATDPPNPNPQTQNSVSRNTSTLQLVFNEAGRPATLPLVVSAFGTGFSIQAVTAFNVGETQTIASTNTSVFPEGATFTETGESISTTTLTVVESILAPDHFRVVYATTNDVDSTNTSTDPMFTPFSQTLSSTGTLTLDAVAVGGAVQFSMDFNVNGTVERTEDMVVSTGNGFVVGSLAGTLAAD